MAAASFGCRFGMVALYPDAESESAITGPLQIDLFKCAFPPGQPDRLLQVLTILWAGTAAETQLTGRRVAPEADPDRKTVDLFVERLTARGVTIPEGWDRRPRLDAHALLRQPKQGAAVEALASTLLDEHVIGHFTARSIISACRRCAPPCPRTCARRPPCGAYREGAPMEAELPPSCGSDGGVMQRDVKAILDGALGGVVGTAGMSALMLAAGKAGLMGEHPPDKIAGAALDAVGIHERDEEAQDALASAAPPRLRDRLRRALRPAAPPPALPRARRAARHVLRRYSSGRRVIRAGYPRSASCRPPPRTVPDRPRVMFVAHLIYGAILGTVVERRSPPPDPQERESARLPVIERRAFTAVGTFLSLRFREGPGVGFPTP